MATGHWPVSSGVGQRKKTVSRPLKHNQSHENDEILAELLKMRLVVKTLVARNFMPFHPAWTFLRHEVYGRKRFSLIKLTFKC